MDGCGFVCGAPGRGNRTYLSCVSELALEPIPYDGILCSDLIQEEPGTTSTWLAGLINSKGSLTPKKEIGVGMGGEGKGGGKGEGTGVGM